MRIILKLLGGETWHIDHHWAACFSLCYGAPRKTKPLEIDVNTSISNGLIVTMGGIEIDNICKVCCKRLLRQIPIARRQGKFYENQ